MSKPKRIYVAGPMTGILDHNFPAFHAAADRLRQAGWDVVNPAENFDGRTDLPRARYLRADVALLVQCDAIAVLPGWEDSLGAALEYLLACEFEMPVFDTRTLEPLRNRPQAMALIYSLKRMQDNARDSILDEAKRITAGTRQNDYGHPRDDFARTATIWNGLLASKLREGVQITAIDVPLCMIAVKLARQVHRHKRDNLVDIAGYARTAAMIARDE